MFRWRISRGQAIDIQEWALKESGTEILLNSLPELPKRGKIKPGLYVSFEIDQSELDGGIDWPDVGVATVFAVLKNGHKEFMGEVRAYNWEVVWLSTIDFDEVDDSQEWWSCIKDAYEQFKKKEGK